MLLCSLIWVGEIRLALSSCSSAQALQPSIETLGRIKEEQGQPQGLLTCSLRTEEGTGRPSPRRSKRIVRVAGVRADTRPYDLRKAFATRLVSAGADIKTAMSLTWHTQVAVLLKYYGQGGSREAG